ncbi:hypothetical protein [Haliangium sp.]|uniref:hypothetical protein n=1 Tax=Haliangium sp. TaxID=2663208 RepID=UPI003D12351F
MSQPPGKAGFKGPVNRPPTHKALDHGRMMRLGLAVEDAADGELIDCDAIDELALEEGVDAAWLYASVATTTEVEIQRRHPVAFVACGGNCQNWGALELIELLTELRAQRLDDGRDGFDIVAKSCLDQCEHAPVVEVHTPDGKALLRRPSKDELREAVEQSCD